MKRSRKIALISALMFALAFTAFVSAIIIQLPSIGDLRQQLLSIHRPERLAPTASPPQSIYPNQAATPQPSPSPPRSNVARSDAVGRYLVSRLLNSNDLSVRVCENLDSLSGTPMTAYDQYTEALHRLASSKDRVNPYIESALATLGFALRLPAVRDLVTQAMRAKDTGNSSLVDQSGFKTQLAMATSALWTRRSELERISQHAYHLFVITRAVNNHPEIANNPDTLALCSTIQSAINNGRPVDINAEKAAVLRFLATAGIAPDQVGYDPSRPANVAIQVSDKQISIRLPWFEALFPSPNSRTPTATSKTSSEPNSRSTSPVLSFNLEAPDGAAPDKGNLTPKTQ
jgi:hypothetical protein